MHSHVKTISTFRICTFSASVVKILLQLFLVGAEMKLCLMLQFVTLLHLFPQKNAFVAICDFVAFGSS